MEQELADFFTSLKKVEAQQRHSGARDVSEGKEAMTFGLFQWLANHFLSKGNYFAHTYLILSWCLVCRTFNAKGICLSHLMWRNDSLGIIFNMSKTDQSVFQVCYPI